MVGVEPAPVAAFDAMNRPCTRDGSGSHTYHYTFQFPGGFSEFYLNNYELRANGANTSNTSDIYPSRFVQTSWSSAQNGNAVGDVSFGTSDDPGPLTSYAEHIGYNFDCYNCTLAWPRGSEIFTLPSSSTAFRIGWGEHGPQSEGWCPWWSGTIRLR
jgi:hypothetical protein